MGAVIEIPVGPNRRSLIDEADRALVESYGRWTSAWSKTQYAARKRQRQADGTYRTIYLARVIMGEPDGLVDHINGDKLDNRRSNLRVVNHAQSAMNRRSRGKTSIFKGVSFCRRTRLWHFQVRTAGVSANGSCPTEIEAARAYDEAARQHFGEYARLNFPRAGEVCAYGNPADIVSEEAAS